MPATLVEQLKELGLHLDPQAELCVNRRIAALLAKKESQAWRSFEQFLNEELTKLGVSFRLELVTVATDLLQQRYLPAILVTTQGDAPQTFIAFAADRRAQPKRSA